MFDDPDDAESRKALERGYVGLDADDFDAVASAIAGAREAGVEPDDVRVRYLEFMTTWLTVTLDEDEAARLYDDALGLLDEGVRLEDARDAARVVLDVAEVVMFAGEPEHAEPALRRLCARDDLEASADGGARLLWAQIALDYDEEPAEALEILDAATATVRSDPDHVGLRAAALVELRRFAPARELLEEALARGDDTDLHHQLGMVLRSLDEHEAGIAHLLEVRARDLETHGIDPDAELDPDEAEDLRHLLEGLLGSLPDRALSCVDSATVRAERWPSEAAVRRGGDPRAAVWFEGEPDSESGHVDAIVIYGDALTVGAEHEDRVVDVLTLCLSAEFQRVFGFDLPIGL